MANKTDNTIVKHLRTGVTTFIRPNGHVLASDNKILTRCKYPIAAIAPFDEWMS